MDFDTGIPIPRATVTEGPSSMDEDALWQMNLRSRETMESEPYPVREGEPDCSYYIRTGLCRFGSTCRFNHPPNRKLAIATARMRGEYPERMGQPECQDVEIDFKFLVKNLYNLMPYLNICNIKVEIWNHPMDYTWLDAFALHAIFSNPLLRGKIAVNGLAWLGVLGFTITQYYLKTGTCKFGGTCKFHHPREKAGIAGRVSVNVLGYPLRPNEVECAYYLRTGQCKFGGTCKFHHPQPSNMMVSFRSSPVYPHVPSPTTPTQQSYTGGITNWPLSRASFVSSPRWQGPSNYAPMILPQGMVSVPGWNAYSGQMGSLSSPESQQQAAGTSQIYGTSRQSDATNGGSQGAYSSYRSGSIPVGYYALQRENVFPERPGQPECQFYMKTGDCKFGAVCRFHHPRERLVPVPNCVLSPIGLPLRTGEPLCIFYSRYGICKFGPSCKFDHPMGVFTYNLSASSSADAPVVRRLLGSSSGAGALTLSSEGLIEAGSANPRRLSLPETRSMPSGDDNIDTEG